MRVALRGSQVRSVPRFSGRMRPGAGQAILDGKTIPAPYKGWDASSPLEDMDPAAAIILDNWFPEPAFVRFRGGHAEHASGLGAGPVESLMAYHGPGATEKMFGARGASIFDVSGAGAVGAAVVSGLTNARWQHINFTTPGGSFLVIVNGADAPRNYDGTSWTTPSITGITATQAVHVNAHKNRIWFVLINSTKAAYLPVSSIAGAASTFDLGPFMTRGGYLVAMGTWTMDSGWGPDDFAVFITSKGQVIVYAGNNPADANDWALKGVYNLGPPIGRRCLEKVGGDLALVTIDGVVSLSQAIAQDRSVAEKAAITARIQRAMNEAAKTAKGNFGWQFSAYAKGTAAILNVPVTENTLAHQYVMNTLTGAWCRYTGQNAACWEIFQDRLFMGGLNGQVFEADKGSRDNGSLIVGDLKTAFNHLGQRGSNKRFAMIRALMRSDGQAIPQLTLNTDYRDFAPATVASPFVSSGARWNSFNWNDGTLWGGSIFTLADWISVNDEGYCAAVRMRMAPQNENQAAAITLEVNGFDLKWERATGQL